MSAQVSSAVFVVRGPLVPDTTTPCAAAACRSMEAFCMPVVMSSFRSGSRAKSSRSKRVRSRMATITAAPSSAATNTSPVRCSRTDIHSAPSGRPASEYCSTSPW